MKKIESFWLDSSLSLPLSTWLLYKSITPSSSSAFPFFAWCFISSFLFGIMLNVDHHDKMMTTCTRRGHVCSFVLKRVVSSFYNIFSLSLSSLLLFSCFTKKRLDSSSFIFKVKSSTKKCINNIIKSKRTRMKKQHKQSKTQDNNDFQFSPDLAWSSVCVYVKMHLSNNSRDTVTCPQS